MYEIFMENEKMFPPAPEGGLRGRTKLKKAEVPWGLLLFCLAPRVGLEPTTLRLTAACSTIELSRNAISLLFPIFFGDGW